MLEQSFQGREGVRAFRALALCFRSVFPLDVFLEAVGPAEELAAEVAREGLLNSLHIAVVRGNVHLEQIKEFLRTINSLAISDILLPFAPGANVVLCYYIEI